MKEMLLKIAKYVYLQHTTYVLYGAVHLTYWLSCRFLYKD
jgi:hypothetical protein